MLEDKTLKEIEKSVLHRTTFLRGLNQKQMVELLNKGKFWEDMLRANYNAMYLELREYKKELDEALDKVSAVNSDPNKKYSFSGGNEDVKGIIEIQKEENEKGSTAKFTEAKEKPLFNVFFDYTDGSLCILNVLAYHIKEGKCLLIDVETYKSIKPLLTDGNYKFYQSRETNTNELKVFLWKA